MPANYTHTEISAGATLAALKFNGDHENHITNRVATKLVGYSADATEVQTVFDPGEVGSENLPQTTADEIAALRHAVKEIKGSTHWYPTLETRTENLGWYDLIDPVAPSILNNYFQQNGADSRKRMHWIVPRAYAGGDVTYRVYVGAFDVGGGFTGTAVLRLNGLIPAANTTQWAINMDAVIVADFTVHLLSATIAAANVPSVGERLILDFQRLGDNASDTLGTLLAIHAMTLTYSAYAGRAS